MRKAGRSSQPQAGWGICSLCRHIEHAVGGDPAIIPHAAPPGRQVCAGDCGQAWGSFVLECAVGGRSALPNHTCRGSCSVCKCKLWCG